MLRVIAETIRHHSRIGGIALATIIAKKQRITDDIDLRLAKLQHVTHMLRGSLCGGCISCENGKCHFAYGKYPECFLEK
jgi:hypothetical protein